MNARTYTKLFSCIVTSSMWSQDSDIRVVWITLLALADQYGEISSSIPGLARASNVPIDKCQLALDCFIGPDEYSRTKDNEGRRIEPIDGGWRLLNWDKYRQMMTADERREYKRIHESNRRKRVQNVDNHGQNVDSAWTHTDTDTDTDTEEKINTGASPNFFPPSKNGHFKPPTIEEVKLLGAKSGLPDHECEKLFAFYGSKGWMVGKNRMKSLPLTVTGWKLRWQESQGKRRGQPI